MVHAAQHRELEQPAQGESQHAHDGLGGFREGREGAGEMLGCQS